MKNSLKTTKIFHGLLTVAWILFIAVAFFSGGIAVAGVTLAVPLVVPVIKSAALTEPETLATELNRVFNEMSDGIKQAITAEYKEKGAMSLGELDVKLKDLGIEDNTLKTINDILEAQGLEMQKKINQGSEKTGLKGYIKKAFGTEGLSIAIQKAFSEKNGVIDVTKAVGNITTSNVTTDTGGNALLDMLNADEIADIRLRMPFIEDWATTSNTSKPTYTYVDYLPGEGDVDFIAEGGTKPQIDLDITVKSEAPVKAAGYEILTDESVQDVPRMESNARGLLFKKYLLKRQNGILFGNGISPNPLGVTKLATAYNPATWTANKVKTPNLHDVIIAIATQIYTTFSYTDDVEYYPNVAFVNPSDFASLRVSKNDRGDYIFPSFTLFNDQSIDGIKLVSKSKIPAGKILMGDFSKLNIIDYIAYNVSIGWINDQFIKNLFTMLGEGRFFTFIKALDQRAFVYDDIANVIAGIEEVIA